MSPVWHVHGRLHWAVYAALPDSMDEAVKDRIQELLSVADDRLIPSTNFTTEPCVNLRAHVPPAPLGKLVDLLQRVFIAAGLKSPEAANRAIHQ